MSRPIIICDQLGKSYRLGVKQQKGSWSSANLTLRETFSSSFRSARRDSQRIQAESELGTTASSGHFGMFPSRFSGAR